MANDVSPLTITDELCKNDYFVKYRNDIYSVLECIYTSQSFDEQIEVSRKSLGKFWANYYSKKIAEVLNSFPKIQKALFGLEEDFEKGTSCL